MYENLLNQGSEQRVDFVGSSFRVVEVIVTEECFLVGARLLKGVHDARGEYGFA
jgi:hypothetical protein